MFGLKGFMFVFFTVLFFTLFFSFNASAQSPLDLMMTTSSANASSANVEPPNDPREEQLESVSQEINWLEDQIENYRGWIQGAQEDNDSIGQQIHDLDSKADDFKDQLDDLNSRMDDNFDSIETYEGYISANRDRVMGLDDQRFKLKKDIRENPFHPEDTPATTDPALQPLVSPPAQPLGN